MVWRSWVIRVVPAAAMISAPTIAGEQQRHGQRQLHVRAEEGDGDGVRVLDDEDPATCRGSPLRGRLAAKFPMRAKGA
jgi:hypothetical protein